MIAESPPFIDLIDGNEFVEKLKKLGLGVEIELVGRLISRKNDSLIFNTYSISSQFVVNHTT